ncbi:MAG TPA: hypothetical protein VIT67_20770, partial [Povalibacter sp.]
TYKKYKPDPEPPAEPVVQAPQREGDVLEIFEEDMSRSKASTQNAMTERARGVVSEESEDLLSPDELQTDATGAPAPIVKPEAAKPVAATSAKQTETRKVAEAAKTAETSKSQPTESPKPIGMDTLPPVAVADLLEMPKSPVAAPVPEPAATMPSLEFDPDLEEFSPQTLLFPEPPPPAPAASAQIDAFQLELLADPPQEERKLAANDSR